ncbi:MAG: spiro-SPASM protein [Spirochaetaceae bacterium]|nr:spiro-SPASM protein [Spirochaetaceae bacterium]
MEALAETALLPADGDGQKAEALFFARGDSPLLDGEVTETLWKLHYKYDAEYTFADGYPLGLAPEILSTGLPEKLRPLAKGRDDALKRDTLFEVLRQDINAFDVETHLSPKDLRMDRVSMTSDTRRNRNIAEKLYAAGGTDAKSLCEVIPSSRHLLRDLPAYFPIQVTEHCPQDCSYLPYPIPSAGSEPRHMASGDFETLCRKIVDFAGDAVLDLSLMGEPASHPDIADLIRTALDAGTAVGEGPRHPRTRVLIETSGLGWNLSDLEHLAEDTTPGRLMWIVTLDASDPDIYRSLRGEGLEEAENTARELVRLFGRHCWIQATRMNKNEEHLEDFYRIWSEQGAQVIVQKYDSYAGFLPERQPADLSPLNRFPCWHLKRDMPILVDGTVPICKDDLGRRDSLGNAFTEQLENIWAAGEELFVAHSSGKYPGICAGCDEFYTFNF